jgi:hypothetical protein
MLVCHAQGILGKHLHEIIRHLFIAKQAYMILRQLTIKIISSFSSISMCDDIIGNIIRGRHDQQIDKDG